LTTSDRSSKSICGWSELTSTTREPPPCLFRLDLRLFVALPEKASVSLTVMKRRRATVHFSHWRDQPAFA